jgi:3',5'-cyclic AMP phosphodiesterase CpdA
LKLAQMPIRHGAGNHEMLLTEPAPRRDFEQRFGPTYYSFDWGRIHCIVLDGNKPIPGVDGYKAVHGAVEASELAWLRADLAAQPPGQPIIVGIHIPIVTTYPQRRRESPPDAPYWEIANRDVLTQLLGSHHVRLVLQGHMHENQRTMVQGVEYVSSMALAGSWYQSGPGLERGVDGSPRGYRIVSVDGTRITHRYQSSAESRVERQGEFSGLDQPVARGAAVPFVFNCYDAPDGAVAEARLDDGDWQPMPAFAATNEKIGLTMPHHFRLLADTTALSSGRHALAARVRWADGMVVTEQAEFTVAAR